MTVAKVWDGAAWVPVIGAQGPPGAVEVFEQPDTPGDGALGALWIDTDAPTPVPGVGPTGPQGIQGSTGAGVATGGTTGQALIKKSATDYDTEWGVAGAPPEVLVGPTQPIGTEVIWVDTDEPSWAGPPIFVTALPSSPVDGMEVYYQSAAMATNGIVWHLRYRAASASAYKWEFVGGSQLVARYGSVVAVSATSYTNIGPTPFLVFPLAGDYQVWQIGRGGGQSAGQRIYTRLGVTGPGIVAGGEMVLVATMNTSNDATDKNLCNQYEVTGVAAGNGLYFQAMVQSGTVYVYPNGVAMRPVRVG
jgi:hypothetical protein